MAEREKYYIGLNGQTFEVSRELYEAYYKGHRKEKYFTHDLKQEHTKVDKKTGEIIVIPSREDSYERLLEAEKQFAEEAENVEETAVRAVMLEKLSEALHTLTEEETAIIHALFYREISEAELAKKLGIARTTLQSRKYKILEKLKKYCKNFRQAPLPNGKLGEGVFFCSKLFPLYSTLTISYLCVRHISDRPGSRKAQVRVRHAGITQARTICGFTAHGRAGCDDTGRR